MINPVGIISLFGAVAMSLYIYKKILGLDFTAVVTLAAIAYSAAIPAVILLLVGLVPLSEARHLTILPSLLIILAVSAFVGFVTKDKIKNILPAAYVSTAIYLGVYGFARLVWEWVITLAHNIYVMVLIRNGATEAGHIPPLFFHMQQARPVIYTPLFFLAALFLVLTVIFVKLLFKIKYLKSKLFLESFGNKYIVLILSTVIYVSLYSVGLIADIFYNFRTEVIVEGVVPGIDIPNAIEYHGFNEAAYVFISDSLTAFKFLCVLGMFWWWRHQAFSAYRQRHKEKIIQECLSEMENLRKSNAALSKTMHKDNKLIPAMYNAVAKFLDIAKSNLNKQELLEGSGILQHLDEIMQERKDVIIKIVNKQNSLPLTGIGRVDNVLYYMQLKAANKEINFDFFAAYGIKEIAESQISAEKLSTLLADLIENAIIAVSCSEIKKVSVTLGIAEGCFEINIKDSGVPFEVETFANLGIKKSTAYADAGGSGIGYLTIFEILKETDASFIINEYNPIDCVFTKSIIICFDGKCGYSINSFRANEIWQCMKRTDVNICEL